MALYKLNAADALANRKLPFSGWGQRDQPNRVEPVALPGFETPFKLELGEDIFTIGSCFARNVETALRDRGFCVPARQLFEQPDFKGMNPGIMNNFGVASIYNEFSWALEPDTDFDFEKNIVQTGTDRWSDIHIITSIKPAPRDAVFKMRKAILDVTASVVNCRVVIMTLGLNEVWYDLEQDIYLNTAPSPRVLAAFPDRFEFHVLDFEETLGFLTKTIQLLKEKSRADQQIILTVSPVPLGNTMRPQDVMVANCYSKSCLRTATEHICMTNDHVTYFPSYESITLSDRKIAWERDLTHVTKEIVQTNVGRMVQAYTPGSTVIDGINSAIEKGSYLELENEAVRLLTADKTEANRFFDQFAPNGSETNRFAFSAAQHYLRVNNPTSARQQINYLGQSDGSFERAMIDGPLAFAEGNHDAVISSLAKFVHTTRKQTAVFWVTLIRSYGMCGDAKNAKGVALAWITAAPARKTDVLLTLAKAVIMTDPAMAVNSFKVAFADTPTPMWRDQIAYAEALYRSGDKDAAQTHFANLKPATHGEQAAFDKLGTLLGAGI